MDTDNKNKRRCAETAKSRGDFLLCVSPRPLRLCVLPHLCLSVFIRVYPCLSVVKDMSAKKLSASRARQILAAATKTRILVVGDVMPFIWGGVSRSSPEAPVPVVDFQRESFMPGGATSPLTAFLN